MMMVRACVMAMLVAGAEAQSLRDWKAIRNNRNNDVQIFEPIPMFNNFRKTQPIGDYRKVFRSSKASDKCLSRCSGEDDSTACVREEPPTKTKRRRAYSTFFHWDYSDQRRWNRWIHPMKWDNECLAGSTGPSQWGESPINIDPFEAEEIDVGFHANADAYIDLADSWQERRPFLFVNNNGHSVQLTVCGNNIYDCKARATFGDWPCKMRGANCSNDQYVLTQLHFHWGEDSTKGSEHTVCGSPRSAEMHMVFINERWGHPTDPVPWDMDKPERGVRLLVMGTLIESNGDGPDNEAFAPILDAVQFPEPRQNRRSFRDRGVAHWANSSGPSQGPIDLWKLLPANYSEKFYSYPGSLTTPPCSQFVSWFVFENSIKFSEKQLNQLRSATTYYHFPHPHPHYYAVILFACVMLILGTLTKQYLERYAPTVPYTMVVMLWGYILNFLASINNDGQLNPMQQSLRMWSNIDGHLALYVFLPALIFGDVMKVNIHTFFQTFKQACFLAGPAVLLTAYLTALVVKYVLPYGWSWSFCMAIGAILAATDPVAVLALMKNLGAPKSLTWQVSGESLLNDGTSVILFTVFFDMSRLRRGQYANVWRLIRIMTRFLLFSPCLGIVVGAVGVYWMARVSTHRHSKAGSLVQLCVTLITAYLGFFLSDNSKIGQASGILTTVAAGLVLAYRVWPVVISKEAMENVWSTLEHILNTMLFGLVGVQMSRGKLSHNVNWRELYWVVVLYAAVFVIRGVIVFVSAPILNLLGPHKVHVKECTFLTLGGLRGAVSLSLAIFVKQIRSNTMRTWPDDDDHDGERTLFLVGGVAFLSLLINAPICHPILKRFNMIASTNEAKRPIVECARKRVSEAAERAYEETCLKLEHDAVDVTAHLRSLAHVRNPTPVATKLKKTDAPATGFDTARLEAALRNCEKSPDTDKLPALRDTFLSIVHAEYWRMIDSGELPKAARATITLLRSIDQAKDELDVELHDFQILDGEIGADDESSHQTCFRTIDRCTPTWFTMSSELFYKVEYERYEVGYYVLRAFALAHDHAQRAFVHACFGEDREPHRAEELVVLCESTRLVDLANARLEDISPNLKNIVKSKIVAERVLEAQRSALHKLLDTGVLDEAEVDAINREIDDDQRRMALARKQQTQAIATLAVVQEKLFEDVEASGEWIPSGLDNDAFDASEFAPSMKRNNSKNNLLTSLEQFDVEIVSSGRRNREQAASFFETEPAQAASIQG